MKFVSKRDIWLSIVVWLLIIVMPVLGLLSIFDHNLGIIGAVILFMVYVSFALLVAWLWIGTYYVLEESSLIIRTGPTSKAISFSSITSVQPIRSWMASAATSSERLEIRYGKYEVVHISPFNKKDFLLEMMKRCPHARITM